MENNQNNKPIINNEENSNKNNDKNNNLFTIILIIIVLFCGFFILTKKKLTKPNPIPKNIPNKIDTTNDEKYSKYHISSNSLEDFDLYFLQLENEKKNKIYSPLSIKYALEMLKEGTEGKSKEQISNIIGTYKAKKYTNSKNMSLANALFIKDSYKESIEKDYINNLINEYNAEVIYDSFKTPNNLNSWINEKTLNLISEMFNDISNEDFILVNALAINMEWVNQIQDEYREYYVNYAHRDFFKYIFPLIWGGTPEYVEIGAVANKYDIIKDLGEDKIRKIVGEEYREWLADGAPNGCGQYYNEEELDADTYLDKYMKEISKGYNDISSSTDFSFYTDDDVKVFAKDLKKYDDTTLQYIGIMPKKKSLDNYIKNIKALDINTLISNLKTIELENFKEGVITEITGYIPMFKFEYELSLMKDLNKLGIIDVFDPNKADLSKLTPVKNAVIDKVAHKTNIEFSNDGIKAAAIIATGGKGGGDCGFDYHFPVPVEHIDLTFNKPYMFIIRDKDTGEIWFVGTVYEPLISFSHLTKRISE